MNWHPRTSCGCATAQIHKEVLQAAESAIGKEAMNPALFENPLDVAAAVYDGILFIDDKGILRRNS